MSLLSRDNRLLDAIDPRLEEGEWIEQSFYSLHFFSKDTELLLKILGFYVLGLLFCFLWSDATYIVVTNRRVIWVELTKKYLWIWKVTPIESWEVRSVRHEQGSMYDEVHLELANGPCRLVVPRKNFNFAENGRRAFDAVGRIGALNKAQPVSAAAAPVVTAPNPDEPRRVGWAIPVCIGLVIGAPLAFVVMIALAMVSDRALGGFDNAATVPLLAWSGVVFLLPPILVPASCVAALRFLFVKLA